MIPDLSENFLTPIEDEAYSSYTYKMNIDTERINGYIDGQEAMKQAIYKRLLTPRGQYDVYSSSYGLDYNELFGMPIEWVIAVLPDMIKDTLNYDDRIQDISDIKVEAQGKNKVFATFTVLTDFGAINNMEVMMDV